MTLFTICQSQLASLPSGWSTYQWPWGFASICSSLHCAAPLLEVDFGKQSWHKDYKPRSSHLDDYEVMVFIHLIVFASEKID